MVERKTINPNKVQGALLTPKDAKDAFFLLPTPLRFLLEKMVEKEGINNRVAKVEKENLENGSIAYIFFQDGKSPSHVLVVRPGKEGQRASYLLSKPLREGESLQGMELHEVGSEFHAQMLLDALSDEASDALSNYVVNAIGYQLSQDGTWKVAFAINGSSMAYMSYSRAERLERSKKIAKTLGALHSLGFGYHGGLSFEAVDFAAGKAKARNPVKLYALEEHEKEQAFFELVTTLARLGKLSEKELSEIAKGYLRQSPACRDIVGSYARSKKENALPMHRLVASLAHKYSLLFENQRQGKQRQLPDRETDSPSYLEAA